jgi:hypothetical protein
MPLNLVSPLQSVESVIVADQAAGGAPPESAQRVLRFGFARLRHRERAITARDFEDLALQSSPDVVQARAFVHQGQVNLIVVMRGDRPEPTVAQIRDLQRQLAISSPASFGSSPVSSISGPKVRKLRISLTLLLESLDHSGRLERDVTQKLALFFDSASGGPDQLGWALGECPTADDIAFAIAETPDLLGMQTPILQEVKEDRGLEWPKRIAPDELVVLDTDQIRIDFETTENPA